jgi:hypothetical protein
MTRQAGQSSHSLLLSIRLLLYATTDPTLDEFTKVLLRKQNNWFDRYPPHGSRPRQAPYHQGPYYQPLRHQSEQRHQLAMQSQGPQSMPGPN